MMDRVLWTSPNGKWSIVRADPAKTRHPDSPYAVAVLANGQEIGNGWVGRSGRADLEQSVEVEAPRYVREKAESLLLRGSGTPRSRNGSRQRRPEFKAAPEWTIREEEGALTAYAYERGRDGIYQLYVYTAPNRGRTYYEAVIYARTPSGEKRILFDQGYTDIEYCRAASKLTGEVSGKLTEIDRIVEHSDYGEFFSLPGSPVPRSESVGRVNDPFGFSKGVMPNNPPKAYIAVLLLPNGDVAFTHEYTRKFLEEAVIPDALKQSKGRLLDVIPLENKQKWIDEHRGKGTPKPNPKLKGGKR